MSSIDVPSKQNPDPWDLIAARLPEIDRRNVQLECLVDEPDRFSRLRATYLRQLNERGPSLAEAPLQGWLVGVKDLISVSGLSTRCGSLLPPGLFELPPSSFVERIQQGVMGGLVLAKTTTDEFAYDPPPSTKNPLDFERTPGGSSAGSASSVAAGICDLALGTQTTASVIAPASFCGIVGFKPSRGVIPLDGVIPVAPSLDAVGLFASTMERLVLSLNPLLPSCAGARAESPRIGVLTGAFNARLPDFGWTETFDQAVHRLDSHQLSLREVELPFTLPQLDRIDSSGSTLVLGEMARVHERWFSEYGTMYRSFTARAIERGNSVTDATLNECREVISGLRKEIDLWFSHLPVDVVICPSQLGPAPLRITGRTSWGHSTKVWSMAGCPALSLPAGRVNGMPVGLQIVARPGFDRDLLSAALYLADLDLNSIAVSLKDLDLRVPSVYA